jgi:hypothetical protein
VEGQVTSDLAASGELIRQFCQRSPLRTTANQGKLGSPDVKQPASRARQAPAIILRIFRLYFLQAARAFRVTPLSGFEPFSVFHPECKRNYSLRPLVVR